MQTIRPAYVNSVLKDGDSDVRAAAVNYLASMGGGGEKFQAASAAGGWLLANALRGRERPREHGGEKVHAYVVSVLKVLADGSWPVRTAAVNYLASMGMKGHMSTPCSSCLRMGIRMCAPRP